MKQSKTVYLLLAALMLLVSCATPKEKTDNKPEEEEQTEKNIWATVSDGDKLFNPSKYNNLIATINLGILEENRSWCGGAWRNDHVSSRLDILTFEEGFSQVSIEVGDLVSEDGSRIDAKNITAGYLAAIDSKSEAYPDIAYKIYDVITRNKVQDMDAQSIYSAWVDIYIPKDTPKGTYKGRLKLMTGDELVARFDYELEVFDFTLTEPEEWRTFLDLWETPFASNRYYSGKDNVEYFALATPERQDTNPFSLYYIHLDPKYQAGLESELELYHKAGGNTISVQMVEGVDNSRFPCPTPSLIKWIRKKDGTFTYDYSDMDYWVELNLKHGINRQIDLFHHTGVGWGFVYYDEETGTVTNKMSAQPGEPRYFEISHNFFQDLAAHLEEKGWFDMAVVYMDERLYAATLALVEAVESVTDSKGNKLKVGGAVNGNEVEPLYDRMYDISIWENAKPKNAAELAESRRAKGLQTTFYTCGSGKMASTCNPAEAAYAVYEARKYKMDGVMRWAINKYDLDPLHGTLHTTCYPGDCYLIYPDEKDSPEMKAQSSPRFEKLCEGMRVSEKLNLIRDLHPEYTDAVDAITNYPKGRASNDAIDMRELVTKLSRAVQNGQPAPEI